MHAVENKCVHSFNVYILECMQCLFLQKKSTCWGVSIMKSYKIINGGRPHKSMGFVNVMSICCSWNPGHSKWLLGYSKSVMVQHVRCCPFLVPWWRHQMETFSALLALCAGNSPVTGKFPSQRPVTWSFDVFFDLGLNKRLSKQSWGWWFETP